MTSSESLWGEHAFSSGKELAWDIGETHLRCKLEGQEVWLAHSPLAESKPAGEDSEQLEWSRWALNTAPQAVVLIQPALPDKSVLVKPENPFRLLPGVEARVFVRVPVWISISIPGNTPRLLSEIPSVVLSLAWFGTTMQGELCYWLSSTVRRKMSLDLFQLQLAVCPVQIKNTSQEELLVDKLCLRVNWLSLFLAENYLWSDETRISYRGTGEVSNVKVSGTAPAEAEHATILAKPREPLKKGFTIRKSFFAS